MSLDRRNFLRRVATAGGGAFLAPSLSGLAAWNFATPAQARAAAAARNAAHRAFGYGPLVRSADCPELQIPEAFRVVRISTAMQPSPARPGLIVPNAFDGMATFALPNGNIRLIRNHEMVDTAEHARPIGTPHYDARCSGGTTSLEVRVTGEGMDLRVEVVDEFVSLAGTRVNCAGGPTPWGSWLSCEENCFGPYQGFEKPHGYIFEVPASATGPVDPVPLRAMGRFVHEAVAVDPATGIVYETEDAWYRPGNARLPGAGFYRFLPNRPGVLADGGRLQIMVVQDRPRYVTARGMKPGTTVPAAWVDLDDPDPDAAERDSITLFRDQGLPKGAAIFARLEGAFHGDDGIYIVSTNGGDAQAGQVFHYRPTSADGGELTLIFESPSREVLDAPDNICISPRGGIVMCEDGGGDQFVRGLDAAGQIVDLVRHPQVGRNGPGEFAGSCWSPDGRVLFFNVQGGRDYDDTRPSGTYAMWGPWETGPL